MTKALHKVSNTFNRILYAGLNPAMSYVQRRKVMSVNLAGIVGGCCSATFLISNLTSGYWLLSGLDILTMACGFSMPVFQRYGFQRYPPVIGVILFSLCCSFSAYSHHNNTEYFLLLFIGVSFILWSNTWVIALLSLGNAISFFLLQMIATPILKSGVPLWNKGVVLAICLALYIGFLAYFKDMYNRQLTRVGQQNHQLMELNAHNEKIMSVVAHDIRSPIANVGSVLKMLHEGLLSREEFDELSIQLISQVSNLEVSITSLLGWSKNQINNPGATPHNFSLVMVLDAVLAFLAYQLQAKMVQVNTAGIRQMDLYADRDQVEVILRNLISNAIKFSHAGSEVIVSSESRQGMAHLLIKDQGIGIGPVQLKELFGGVPVVSNAGTGNEKGTGLGLKLAREFARMNNGELLIFSESGVGTTCELLLPIAVRS